MYCFVLALARVNSNVIRLTQFMDETPYTRDEVLAAGNNLPERGLVCDRCHATIPVFGELSEKDESRIRHLIRNNQKFMAITELRAATGCSLPWAKLWVTHEGRPNAAEATTPCPHCGSPLRTSLAKQCRFCLQDWHDPNVVHKLGAG
jgi:hypothetical protein